MLIPETQAATTLGEKPAGAKVNLEGDLIGKYVARLLSRRGGAGGRIDEAFLKEHGFA
jgi:riboflavin synthase